MPVNPFRNFFNSHFIRAIYRKTEKWDSFNYITFATAKAVWFIKPLLMEVE